MAKRLVVISLTVLLVSYICMVALPVGLAADPPTVAYVDPPKVENEALTPDSTFNVTVKVADIPTDPGLAGIEFKLSWNSSVLNAVSMQDILFHEVTPEEELDNLWRIKFTVANDSVTYAYTFQDMDRAKTGGYMPITGNHTVAEIKLKVKAVGKTTLHFDNMKLGDPEANTLPRDVADGFFSNLAPPPPPKAATLYVDPEKTVNASLTSGSNFTVNVNIANASGLAGLEFKLNFNISVLNANSIVNGSFIPSSVMPTTEINNTDGYVRFNVSLSTPLDGEGTVAIVEFQVMADSVRNSTLHLSDVSLVDSAGEPLLFTTVDGSFTNIKALVGDLNEDGIVDIFDAMKAALIFGTFEGHPNFSSAADMDNNGKIDIFDFILLGANFGRRA